MAIEPVNNINIDEWHKNLRNKALHSDSLDVYLIIESQISVKKVEIL